MIEVFLATMLLRSALSVVAPARGLSWRNSSVARTFATTTTTTSNSKNNNSDNTATKHAHQHRQQQQQSKKQASATAAGSAAGAAEAHESATRSALLALPQSAYSLHPPARTWQTAAERGDRDTRRSRSPSFNDSPANPWPAARQTTIAEFLRENASKKPDELAPQADPARIPEDMIALSGRIDSKRSSAKTLFYHLVHGEHRLQIVCTERRHDPEEFALLRTGLHRGDIVHVVGYPFLTQMGELSLASVRTRVLAPCIPDIPFKLTDPDIRARQRALDMLANPQLIPRMLKTRHAIFRSIRRMMDAQGFIEVETPSLCALAGGANARPFITKARAISGHPLNLRIAPELYLKQLVIGGIDRVYEIGKQFRNEGMDADHHPEFTTMEMYQAYANFDDLFDFTESLLVSTLNEAKQADKVLAGVFQHHQRVAPKSEEGSDPLSISYQGQTISFQRPFKRISIMPALEEALGEPLPDLAAPTATQDLINLFERRKFHGLPQPPTIPKMIDELVSLFLEPQCINPTFLCYHPKAMSPLARESPENPALSLRFELFVNGFEICNAYAELNNPHEQRARFAEQAKVNLR
ncbi:lysyl-tRNA synthetase [Capsaspora owczarzaki ATCC 30864]|uniref:lysyl-tRNA synthetase n=1 Tax=Capsaspora owczarzaki (strain ATCC 30864) TaxID=595528 RepID=UPI0001FE4A73|nr:lysyl-tRNA synthetase [Capsaspora owczarzaki ATCC 30864]|eukprot:XP_004347901.1 lysyl-tRNA synthetase [Capsaspora owczarzaki ATCC 30864]